MDLPKTEETKIVATATVPPAKAWHQSKIFVLILKGLVAVILALLIFQLGMFVGFRKASFSFGWGDNYNRVFGGPQGGLMHDFMGRDFMNGHGIAGAIVQIDGSSLIIKGGDGAEKVISVTDQTSIVKGRSPARISDLSVGEAVTVIGRPGDDGIVAAEIIRILSPGPMPGPNMNIFNQPPRY